VHGGALGASEIKQPPPPPSSSSSASWRPHQQASTTTHPQQHQPVLETAVTNSPSMEERHCKGKAKVRGIPRHVRGIEAI
jgi:hypothetical protein